MKLYFIFYEGMSFVSKAIKWRTNGIYSHVGEILDTKTLFELSAWEGVNRKGERGVVGISSPECHRRGTPYDVYSIEVSNDQYNAFKLAKQKRKGAKYDYLGILGFATNKAKFNKRDKWFCSELEAQCCKEANIPLFNWNIKFPELTSPSDFASSPILQFEFSGIS